MNKETQNTLIRGFKNRCPSCGEGKLLRGYTTPNETCSHCDLDFEPLRADDGPAWATILIAGHLAMPFVFWILEQQLNNTAVEISASVAVIVALCAVILPRAKGMFMAVIWMMHVKKDKKNLSDDNGEELY